MEIGGPFPYKQAPLTLPFVTSNYLLLTNARSALYVLYNLLKPNVLWLPSYICKSLLHSNYNIKFYSVDEKLRCDIKNTKKGDLVLVVDYFGFPYKNFETEAIVVEDASQGFFTVTKADYVIYSPTKWLGCPDGGILWSKKALPEVVLEEPPYEWLYYARNRDKFLMAQKAKALSPTGFYSMKYKGCLYFDRSWSEIYVRNYNYLLERLPGLMGELSGTIPNGFPIVVEERDKLREFLIKNQIYPPVHWEIKEYIPKEFGASHWLSERILTIPCDYRYNLEDMERIVKCILDSGLKLLKA